jgi:hypothetical protein
MRSLRPPRHWLALAGTLALALPLTALAQASRTAPKAVAAAPAAAKAQTWSAWGGTVGIRWNRDLAADLGLKIGAAQARHAELSFLEHEVFDLQPVGSLDFEVRGGNLRSFVGGSLQARGGHVLDAASGRIDLTNFRLVPRAPQAGKPPLLDLVSADGVAWFYIDRLMYELIDGKRRLAVRTMDVRITPELARRLGAPEVADMAIADMEMTTDVQRQGADDPQPLLGSTKWHGLPVPGVPGATYQADLFMTTFDAQYSRCTGCTGAGGNGSVVFTPSSTLRNNRNNGTPIAVVPGDPRGTSSALYTADIPWYQKFSGNFPPYGNDQHPYLIWNLYRLNADGTIDQIGRSGVKHAFLTLNTACDEDPFDSHILGRGCADVYSVGNNDNNQSLGPRSEIIPSTNQWGRCGSIYDTNCDGFQNSSTNTNFDQRLVVRESQFSGAAHAGATFLFESWYLARQDIDILNSMGTKRVTFSRPGTVWVVGGNDQYKLGPAIDRWVDPAAPGPNASSVQISTAEGNVKVASKVTDLGGGRWRYDYAVMNLDFSRAITEGAEPNLRVLSNQGFNGLAVPAGTATITDLKFSDGDLDATNDWTASVSGGNVFWVAPAGNSLNWGTMFRFSFIANRAPGRNSFQLSIAGSGSPKVLKGSGLMAPPGLRGRS